MIHFFVTQYILFIYRYLFQNFLRNPFWHLTNSSNKLHYLPILGIILLLFLTFRYQWKDFIPTSFCRRHNVKWARIINISNNWEGSLQTRALNIVTDCPSVSKHIFGHPIQNFVINSLPNKKYVPTRHISVLVDQLKHII